MLKLKNLFDNRDLAKMIVENWEYDTSGIWKICGSLWIC
jgi:hypothetical protein